VSSRVFVALRVAVSRDRAFDVFVNDIGAWWQALLANLKEHCTRQTRHQS